MNELENFFKINSSDFKSNTIYIQLLEVLFPKFFNSFFLGN